MDIKKEREAFLNVYVNYKGDSRKIQFNEETEQFMWRKNNVSDTEVEYVHLMNQRWYAWLACAKSKAQAVPEGFVEKTESNTHHYFKLKDWDEWTCIDGIKDAITSDHDINAIVEVECLEVIEINNKPCFALLAFGKRHGTEVKFFDTEEEAIEAQEPTND